MYLGQRYDAADAFELITKAGFKSDAAGVGVAFLEWGTIEQDDQGRTHYVFPDDPRVIEDNAPARESRK